LKDLLKMRISNALYDVKPPLKNIQAVIIDLDGTMIDSAHDFLVTLNKIRSDLSLSPVIDIETVRRFIGRGSVNLIQSALRFDNPGLDIEFLMPDAMISFHRHYLEDNGRYSAVYPGVKKGLEAMKAKNIQLACITNKPALFTEPLLARMGLFSYFDLIYCADSFPHKKPKPLPSLMACGKFGLLPSQVVAIGDSVNDAQAAYAAGCPLFIVPYGYNHGEDPKKIKSNAIVSSLKQAADFIA